MTISRSVQGLLAVLLWSLAAAASASFHLWRVSEIYSNADGTVQFIEFHEIGGQNGEQFLAGHMLTTQSGNVRRTYTFPDNLPGPGTANHYFLAATQGFANLGILTPDFIIPNGFLFQGGGQLEYGATPSGIYMSGDAPVDTINYPALPTDGASSIDRNGAPHTNSPTNFAGATGAIAPVATVSPQTGWWWNPNESGRGFFIERQGANLFFAGYLYADDGRAMWVLSAGAMASTSSYQGSLLSLTGGQTLTGAYRTPVAAPPVGSVSLQFSDATHGTLTWPGGSVPIQRDDFAGIATPMMAGAPETGWWWNSAENGRGFSLEVQGSTMFIAGYMYDASGNPIWYISVGPMSASMYPSGAWMQFAGGQTMMGPYHAPVVANASVGSITLQFTDAQNGTMTLPDSRVIPISRFRF